MNCRDPTATSRVMLPSVTAEVLAMFRTSPILHSSGAASKSFTLLMTSVFSGFRSDSGVGDTQILQKKQHLGWVAHDVTTVYVPMIRQASASLHRMLRVVGTCELFWAAKLEVG